MFIRRKILRTLLAVALLVVLMMPVVLVLTRTLAAQQAENDALLSQKIEQLTALTGIEPEQNLLPEQNWDGSC